MGNIRVFARKNCKNPHFVHVECGNARIKPAKIKKKGGAYET